TSIEPAGDGEQGCSSQPNHQAAANQFLGILQEILDFVICGIEELIRAIVKVERADTAGGNEPDGLVGLLLRFAPSGPGVHKAACQGKGERGCPGWQPVECCQKPVAVHCQGLVVQECRFM